MAEVIDLPTRGKHRQEPAGDIEVLESRALTEAASLLRGQALALPRESEVRGSFLRVAEHYTAASMQTEGSWMRTWWDHVGSVPMLFGVHTGAGSALLDARLAWLDEIDGMSDMEILRVPGIGRRYLAHIRAGLVTYYWRGDPAASADLWKGITQRLRRSAERRGAPESERVRALDGIAFALGVLADAGAPLSDPSAPRRSA